MKLFTQGDSGGPMTSQAQAGGEMTSSWVEIVKAFLVCRRLQPGGDHVLGRRLCHGEHLWGLHQVRDIKADLEKLFVVKSDILGIQI